MQTLLIVDDEPLITRVLSRILRGEGYTVVTHDSGFGLRAVVRRNRPHLVLLDVNMPGLGGEGACSALRALSEKSSALEVPVIFHSGKAPGELAALARVHGAVGYLCKPAGNAELLATVARVLASGAPATGT